MENGMLLWWLSFFLCLSVKRKTEKAASRRTLRLRSWVPSLTPQWGKKKDPHYLCCVAVGMSLHLSEPMPSSKRKGMESELPLTSQHLASADTCRGGPQPVLHRGAGPGWGGGHGIKAAVGGGNLLLLSLALDGGFEPWGRLFGVRALLWHLLWEEASTVQPRLSPRETGLAHQQGKACTCSSRVSGPLARGSSRAVPRSAGRASAEAARTWVPPELCRKDLTGVRSRYTRSRSLSARASAAGAASSVASTCKNGQAAFTTDCLSQAEHLTLLFARPGRTFPTLLPPPELEQKAWVQVLTWPLKTQDTVPHFWAGELV